MEGWPVPSGKYNKLTKVLEPDKRKRTAKYFPKIGDGSQEYADEHAMNDGLIFIDSGEQDMTN